MKRDLIYDIGMNNGDDTAFYLTRGYRVLAIEANPELAEAGRKRFATEIAERKVEVLSVAIGAESGRALFWISSNPQFSSFDRVNAQKWDNSAYEIDVECRPMRSILAEYGIPFYMKIDIERADHFCLQAIDRDDPPEFLSFEKGSLEDLLTARSKGYSRFKIIDQEDFNQIRFTNEGRFGQTIARYISRVKGRLDRLLSGRRVNSLAPPAYAYGSSGPFGEETDGPWQSMEQVAFTWLAFDLGYIERLDPILNDWFDIHCGR
jgi:FkbM family methyltransferase